MNWTLEEIRGEFRDLIGRHTTDEVSDGVCNAFINEYYVQYFPEEAGVSNFQTDYSFDTTAADSGEYPLPPEIIAIEEPCTIDRDTIARYTDRARFFAVYPADVNAVRTRPRAVYVGGNTLFLRPRPDDVYTFEVRMTLQRPAPLANDAAVPLDKKWGKCLAVGGALLWMVKTESDTERLTELIGVKQALLGSIASKRKLQWIREGRTVRPGF